MIDGVGGLCGSWVSNHGVFFFLRKSMDLKNTFFRSMKYLKNILHILLIYIPYIGSTEYKYDLPADLI